MTGGSRLSVHVGVRGMLPSGEMLGEFLCRELGIGRMNLAGNRELGIKNWEGEFGRASRARIRQGSERMTSAGRE